MYSKLDRDAAYTDGLLSFIRREYSFAPVSITPAKRGYYGETWRLNTAVRSYFIKLDYSAAHKDLYERSFHIMEHLANHGIDFISRIVKTADGRLSARYDRAVLGVFDWIDGENIQNERTKIAEYQMLARIYTVPYEGLTLPREEFSTESSDLFYKQWNRLKCDNTSHILDLLEKHRELLRYRAERLKRFSKLCAADKSHFYITHGDAGGNVIVSAERYFIVDWDTPTLAPPERDAWFCLYWDWAIAAFNNELQKNGITYTLRTERLAYYCYHSFFLYLTEHLDTYFGIGDRNGAVTEHLSEYFNSWIEEEIKYADKIL
jgi:Ser/Thr protein kinase RdoA (MazF antagonist)